MTFERYDEGPIITDERGIATFEEGAKIAYSRDPDVTPSRCLSASFMRVVRPRPERARPFMRWAAEEGYLVENPEARIFWAIVGNGCKCNNISLP